MENNIVITGNNILTPSGTVAGSVWIHAGKIAEVSSSTIPSSDAIHIDAGNMLVMAGVIDAHVHINEPGRSEWEGFETATKAAIAGGTTTMIEMPLNASPVTTTNKNFALKLACTAGKLHNNVGFYGGVIPTNIDDIDALLLAGTFGIKAFLTHSGIDEFPNVTYEQLRAVMPLLKKHHRPLLVHCELTIPHHDETLLSKHPQSYSAYLKSRPQFWEVEAIKQMINLCREFRTAVHIVHLSAAEALPMIRAAKNEGLPLTVETAPHYLFFAAEDIKDGATAFKCAPPIRERHNNELLWQALIDGTIDFVATDHSPAPPSLKEIQSGNFAKAWGGIASVQFLLPVMITLMKKRNVPIHRIQQWLCFGPALLCNLQNNKGKIAQGYDADIVIVNTAQSFRVTEETILHRHKISPYNGYNLWGAVHTVLLNGKVIIAEGLPYPSACGKVLMAN